MSTTLTIRNLAEPVKQKLRLRAARNGRSMEAEAREILSMAVRETIEPPRTPEEMRERLDAITGIWKDRANGKSTDELMKELRGDD
ncbi:plasmid stabilization protein [Luteolibacter sp. Populi]|uniref:FitA-like ribbon-helix-helix domain-containing protein n=1 Tax=Luteolibacter sp. Populi TaxID=3230487 RepID=UPI0034665E23